MNPEKIFLCRCEDVTLKQVRDLLDQGYTSPEEIKRILRIGMGPCQGKTCGLLLQQEIARYLKKRPEEIPLPHARPLVAGVPLEAIAEAADDER
ncbi:MAG TPA: (2Fe-2S)-binding protein [Candidatus Izemoplasmatales bacterium]|nr:(2Fe-2S)-binding protein [Candidatus Izemoplasmatales bacterium]